MDGDQELSDGVDAVWSKYSTMTLTGTDNSTTGSEGMMTCIIFIM